VAIGDRVEMTFRRLNQSDGIQNYFWKAKPIRSAPTATPQAEDAS
jgi:hydroxymethylglutaryl-CoA synthase